MRIQIILKRGKNMNHIEKAIERYPALKVTKDEIEKAVELIVAAHAKGGKLLLCGNGGSYADCEHIAGELLKGFVMKREPKGKDLKWLSEAMGSDAELLQRGLCAIPLPSISGALTAYINDVDPTLSYAQLVYSMGKAGDVLIAISTSGNSQNVVKAAKCAKALGISVIGLTGESGGELLDLADACIRVPALETYKVQELHLPVYHAICLEVEERLFLN